MPFIVRCLLSVRRAELTCWAICAILLVSSIAAAQSVDVIDFSEQIKPILSDRCFLCHGPDAERREADLRLDQRDTALAESSGEASRLINPGNSKDSEVFLRIASDDEEMRMPPMDSNLSLSEFEIDLVRRWIDQGAPWSEHWSFQPLPDTTRVPPSEDSTWARNHIDRFVLSRMRHHGLRPVREADRETLIRRLSFDLTGLPPSLEEIDEFLRETRQDAYVRLVDRLLNSQRYGERMASPWLDVARYSDTYGYQVDRDRFVWPWRDWVIRAFNRNLPYDEFITQQVAGDLMPSASDDQILATTYNRLHPQKVEGGSTPEEFRIEYVADRNQTFATSFLGLTLECARCHDHKYDPITQREYYQLSAYFDNIDEAGLYSFFTAAVPTPTLRLIDRETRQKLNAAEQRVAEHQVLLEEIAAQEGAAIDGWLKGDRRGAIEAPAAPILEDDGLSNEFASASNTDGIPDRILLLDFEDFDGRANRKVVGKIGAAVRLTGDDAIETQVGNFARAQPFSVALWINSPGNKRRAVIYHRSRAWTDAGSRGYELLLEDDRLSAALIHFWPGNAIRVRAVDPLSSDTWSHVVVTYDGSSRAAGLGIHVDGKAARVEVVRDSLSKNIPGGGGSSDRIRIGERFRDRGFAGGRVDEFQVYRRELTELEIAQLADGRSLQNALQTPSSDLTPAEQDGLRRYYLSAISHPFRKAVEQLETLRAAHNQVADQIPEIMVMRELPQPRRTFLLRRGSYEAPTDEVSPATPASLSRYARQPSRNRLGLAQWLCDPHHPLTARVAVNRYWQLIFGDGLVRTPEDFGSQGRPPTHPALLDWLARDFLDHGWDLKRLLRQIVMSATYRQSSAASPETQENDPENLWLSHAPRHRLPAEMLRDNALFVGGMLVAQIGGPPARPYEVEVSFKPTPSDKGDGLYRRSLYTYWKRTGPAPVMMALDAAKRDVCRVKRERTSSPLQALVMLNGPQFVEAARCLGQRVILQNEENQELTLVDVFRWLTGHRPDRRQLDALLELYAWQEDYFDSHPEDRDAYLEVGQSQADKRIDATRLAATAAVANALLNFDACITKR